MKWRKWILIFIIASMVCNLPLAIAQQVYSADVNSATAQKTKHTNAKDDIEAIGSRKISGGSAGDWYSLARERKIGEKYSQAVEQSANLVHDKEVTEYVNRLGQNLVRNSDAKVPFTIKVIASDQINAFALPGGFLYVNSGLILAVQNEAELAGVMAHEIAHVAARHATRQMTRSQMFNLASIPLVFLSGGVGVVLQEALDVGTPLGVTKFSRGFEAEADYLGVEYLYKAGYDPQAFLSFLERTRRLERHKPGIVAKAFSTHPQTVDRIRKIQSEIARILPAREAYVVSSSDFDDMQRRLNALENGPRSTEHDSGPPTLRRGPSVHGDADYGEPAANMNPSQ
jgi:predicted Zn-dependent protease